jgi:hypothetical protein
MSLPMHSESWPSWLIGLAIGVLAGILILLGGGPFLFLSVAILALAFRVVRGLAYLSGAFVGLGATWLALTVRAQLACDAFNAAPNQGCRGFGVGPFLTLSAGILVVGVILGLGAWRRRAGQASSQTGR